MTSAFASRHRAGLVLRCVLVLLTSVVSFLCVAGQASARPDRSVPAATTVAGAPTASAAARGEPASPQVVARPAEDGAEAVDASPPDSEPCGKRAAADTSTPRDDHRPPAPLTASAHAERATHTTPDETAVHARDAEPAPPPALARLSVLRI